MASYHSASTSSRGGSRTEQLLAHTRKGAHCITGERITGETPLSYASSQIQSHSQASTQHEEVDEDEQDQPDSPPGSGPQTPTEGQPKKKKTRRAGVAITRVRRMQREVRRLAEEEEANAQRQPQPVRSLLLGVQVPPASPISPTATSPTARQFQGLPFSGAASPPPRAFASPVGSLARTSTERQPRSETPQAGLAAHPRGPAYDRILEDGDDVVLLRLPGGGRPPGSSIWTYRPEERPRGGSA
ncbi:hypothetical protein L226DRAFT_298626 [Lentinus tigrinus ALCF2SS1-7]|uniref:uncharacterized protein n=1 Tax=Lentinus tigrinus ALCF2SS1-7 TaxID=1328758 RepID=UPI001165D1B2|nr:hypothetical protein L226DRAFT_298626 [Lentinus tigrinus ALCF2SS1-7]